MAEGKFHITVGMFNHYRQQQLLKVAMLYGDSVKFCSPSASLILNTISARSLSPRQQMELLDGWVVALGLEKAQNEISVSGSSDAVFSSRLVNRLSYVYGLNVQEDLSNRRQSHMKVTVDVEKILLSVFDSFNEILSEAFVKDGIGEVIKATQSGIVELHSFKSAGDIRSILSEFTDLMYASVSSGSTYPLLDDKVSKVVSSGIQKSTIAMSEAHVSRGKHCALAASLLENLPAFDLASVDEILDIRRDLERPLIQFRAGMMKFAEDIKSAAWDENFPIEANRVLIQYLDPAILEIEDAIESNSYLSELVRKFVDKPLVLPSGSALSLVMSQFTELPLLVSQSLGTGLASAALLHETYKAWQEKQKEIEKNQLFFYYGAKKRLSRKKQR